MRYLAEIAYRGTAYHGWQRQDNATSVQQVVEEALTTILRTNTSITGSGRTDTGVHCKRQFFHFETETDLADKFVYQLNNYLPKDISIGTVRAVNDSGHARFSATSRSYEYHISRVKNPFEIDLSFFYSRELNVTTMNEAAALLIGMQDFEAFSKVKTDVNTFDCDITNARWAQEGEHLVFYISANRFLRGMVRAIVGTLLQVGLGKLTVAEFDGVIQSRNRKKAGASAPAHGLYLTDVGYPNAIFI